MCSAARLASARVGEAEAVLSALEADARGCWARVCRGRMQRLTTDRAIAAVDLFDDDPGHASHVLPLDRDHCVGETLDDLALFLRREHVLDERDVAERQRAPPLVADAFS
jgi:23S rRNA U2552 (ribose-2'-O)-methylase RlmE/FtsJ